MKKHQEKSDPKSRKGKNKVKPDFKAAFALKVSANPQDRSEKQRDFAGSAHPESNPSLPKCEGLIICPPSHFFLRLESKINGYTLK